MPIKSKYKDGALCIVQSERGSELHIYTHTKETFVQVSHTIQLRKNVIHMTA